MECLKNQLVTESVKKHKERISDMYMTVNFSCGHLAEVSLSNDREKREKKVTELEISGLCPECRARQFEKEDRENGEGCACVRVAYEKYRNEMSQYKRRKAGFPRERRILYISLYPMRKSVPRPSESLYPKTA